MTGYHFSKNKIEIGDKIISNQHKGRTWDLVWKYYKELNPKMPYNYGYAYMDSKKKENLFGLPFIHEVECSNFIVGNLDYSVYYTMDSLVAQEFTFNKTIPLKERLKMRDEYLKNQAYNYFNVLNSGTLEIISDNWIVKSILTLP